MRLLTKVGFSLGNHALYFCYGILYDSVENILYDTFTSLYGSKQRRGLNYASTLLITNDLLLTGGHTHLIIFKHYT